MVVGVGVVVVWSSRGLLGAGGSEHAAGMGASVCSFSVRVSKRTSSP